MANTLAAASAVTLGAAIYCQPNCGLSVQICSGFQLSVIAPWIASNCLVLSLMCATLPFSLNWYKEAPAAFAAVNAALQASSAFCHFAGSAAVENKGLPS